MSVFIKWLLEYEHLEVIEYARADYVAFMNFHIYFVSYSI